MLLDELLKLRAVVLVGKGVGILPVGQQADLDVHPLFEQHVDASDGGFDAGCVAVVEHGHIVREAMDHAYLSGGQCRARGCHDILHARLVHGDDVRVAFDQEAAVLLHDGLFGEVDAV